jgi:hypothetical protein
VYMTLGTNTNTDTSIFRSVVEGLSDLDADVLITIGAGNDPTRIGPLPELVRGAVRAAIVGAAPLLGGDLPCRCRNHPQRPGTRSAAVGSASKCNARRRCPPAWVALRFTVIGELNRRMALTSDHLAEPVERRPPPRLRVDTCHQKECGDTDGDVDQEDQPPADQGQQATEHGARRRRDRPAGIITAMLRARGDPDS